MNYTEQQKAEFKEVFAARRRRQIILAVPLVAVMIVLVMSSEGQSATIPGVPENVLLPTALFFVAGALAFSFKNWRCPACNGYLGKAMSPKFCVKCGAPLQ